MYEDIKQFIQEEREKNYPGTSDIAQQYSIGYLNGLSSVLLFIHKMEKFDLSGTEFSRLAERMQDIPPDIGEMTNREFWNIFEPFN